MGTEGKSEWTLERVRFEERSTGFSVVASPDFKLTYDPARGVYELRSERRSAVFMYCRLAGAGEAIDEARAAAAKLGLAPSGGRAGPGLGVVEATSGAGAHWIVRAEREEADTTTRLMAWGKLSDGKGADHTPDDLYVLNSIFPTAQGGVPVAVEPAAPQPEDPSPLWPGDGVERQETAQPARSGAADARSAEVVAEPVEPEPPPTPQPAQPATGQPPKPAAAEPPKPGEPMKLKPFKAPDNTATGMVPDEPGWTVEGVGGIIHAVNPTRGEMCLGLQAQITMPGEIAMYAAQAQKMFGGPVNQLVSPWMSAAQAVVHMWPRVLNQIGAPHGDVQIERPGKVQNAQWASSGDFWITYGYADKPWRGYISMHTSPIAGLQLWRLVCSWVAVPQPGEQKVLEGLMEAAKSFLSKVPGDPAAVKQMQNIAKQSSADTFRSLQEIAKIQRGSGPRSWT
jgi:hypothetical protein